MKKIFCILIAMSVLLAPCTVIAESASAVCVIEAQTGEIVREQNSVARLPMASTTKIMTCIVAIENSSRDDVVTVSDNAARQEGSSAYLGAGEQVTMFDLLHGLMLNSGNDAAVAVAEHISGTVEGFAALMNEKAQQLGLTNTNFTNPNGLPDDEHYTSAYDLAMIARYAMQNETFREIVSAEDYAATDINTGRALYFSNHNKLLHLYSGCIGVKTGFTKAAGRCLVSAAERDGVMLIAVTLNDPNDWSDHMKMLDDAFSKYSHVNIIQKGDKLPYSDYDLMYGDDFSVTVRRGKKMRARLDLHIPKTLKTPVAAGEKIGYASVMWDDTELGTVDICSAADLYDEPKKGERFVRRVKRLFDKILV